jgi:hypothetical protein
LRIGSCCMFSRKMIDAKDLCIAAASAIAGGYSVGAD